MAAPKPNVAALVEQMPETDKDIQAKEETAKQQAQPDAPDKPKPKPDRWGAASKFTGPDPQAAAKIFAEILAGGRESITELLALVREPSDADYKNYKAGYVLHGLVILAGRAGQENQRRLLADALASQLGSNKHSKAVQAVFIRELRTLGAKESVNALGRQLLDDALFSEAALALLAIRDGAAAQFRNALGKGNGRTRVTMVHALGMLQDADSAAALKKALDDPLLRLADGANGGERTEATRNCLLLAERLAANGKQSQANHIYAHLRDTRKDPSEHHIREFADKALGAGRP